VTSGPGPTSLSFLLGPQPPRTQNRFRGNQGVTPSKVSGALSGLIRARSRLAPKFPRAGSRFCSFRRIRNTRTTSPFKRLLFAEGSRNPVQESFRWSWNLC